MSGIDVGEAEREIEEVLVRYATGIDRRDWELFRSCFTGTCQCDYGDIGTWDGVEEITAYMSDAHAEVGHTLHRITNVAVEVDADGATARSYVDAVTMARDGRSGINALGFYDDHLVNTPVGWRIERRAYTMVHVGPIG